MTETTQSVTPASLGLTPTKEKQLDELTEFFKVAGDDTRMHVLFYLCNTPELHVKAICELVGQSQPAVSHHLALLRNAGLIQSRREGKHNFYHIVPRRVRYALGIIFDKLFDTNSIDIDGAQLRLLTK